MRQHIISQVLLKRWAIDGVVGVGDLRHGTARRRAPGAEAWLSDFIAGARAEEAERRWQRFEGDSVRRALEAVEDGTVFSGPGHVEALKGLLGLHLIRARETTHVWAGYLGQQAKDPESGLGSIVAMLNEPGVLDALFTERTGLVPSGPEARDYVRQTVVRDVEEQIGPGGPAFAEALYEQLETFRTRFASIAIEIGVTDGEALLIGDTPALLIDHGATEVGLSAGVTISSADSLLLPIGPRHLLALGGGGDYRSIPPQTVSKVNRLQIERSQEKFYGCPAPSIATLAAAERQRRLAGHGPGAQPSDRTQSR